MNLNFFAKKSHPILPESDPNTFKLGSKTIKIESIPAGATLEMLQVVERLSAAGENVTDSLTVFCELASVAARRIDNEITTEWLLENADLSEIANLACWAINRVNSAFDKNPHLAQLKKAAERVR